MQLHAPIQPCLWFDTRAEEAAHHYIGIFPDSRITQTTRYGHAGHEYHGMAAGTVLTVQFELNGQPFVAMNGGPLFQFNQAVSFQVLCDTQAQIDYYWDRLGEGGDPEARDCGWVKDRYGLSWQVVPADVLTWLTGPRSEAVMAAMLTMKKMDLAALRAAAQ